MRSVYALLKNISSNVMDDAKRKKHVTVTKHIFFEAVNKLFIYLFTSFAQQNSLDVLANIPYAFFKELKQ